MNKAIRILVAAALAFGLGFVWVALLPVAVAAAVSLAVGISFGVLASTMRGPDVLPVYRVEVRADAYEQEQFEPIVHLGGYTPTPRWDDPDIKHLRGVAWYDAEIPPKRHECWPQTDGWIGLDHTQRCACGALRAPRFGNVWMERNSRKPKVAA